jgi:YVTN family beta-propeller protein
MSIVDGQTSPNQETIMNFRKSTLAAVIALVFGSAQALVEVPTVPDPPESSLRVKPKPKPIVAEAAAIAVTKVGDLSLGHGSAGIAVDPVSRKAFVTNYTSGTLSVIDVDTLLSDEYPVGDNPRRLVHNANLQRTYIINDTTPGRVTVFDAKAKQVIAEIPVGKRPRTIGADFAYGEVYVANRDSDTMSVIDVETNTIVAEVSVGSSPIMGGIDRVRGRVYVLSQVDRTLHVIDQRTKKVVARLDTLRSPGDATVDQRTGKVYVNSQNVVQVMDPEALQFTKQIRVGDNTTFGSISDVYRRYYLPSQNDYTVTVVDIDTDEIVRVVTTGASPQQVAIDGAKGNYYVVNRIGNSVSVFDSRDDRLLTTYDVGANPWRIAVGMNRVFVLNENGASADSMSMAQEVDTLAGTTTVTEWYHADLDHFFHSSAGPENRLLGDGVFGNAWEPTYESFRVWTQDGRNRVPVCRFFSTGFGAKSSHFYTGSANECGTLKTGSDWQFEALAYYVELPDAAGACRADTVPLYRLYNDGMGGAPNHRFTTSMAKRDAMTGKGWVREGAGDDGVAACVPSLRGDEL